MGNNNNKDGLMDAAIHMRLQSKTLARQSKKCEKEMTANKLKVKQCIEAGNKEGAQVYAENAIRKKTESLQMLKLSAKMDAVASRIQSADQTQQISAQMKNTIKQLGVAMKDLSAEKVMKNMGKFEKAFETLEVTSSAMTGGMDSATGTMTNANDVDSLIRQVGDEHSLECANMLNIAPVGAPQMGTKMAEQTPATGDASLNDRLAQLRM